MTPDVEDLRLRYGTLFQASVLLDIAIERLCDSDMEAEFGHREPLKSLMDDIRASRDRIDELTELAQRALDDAESTDQAPSATHVAGTVH